MKASSAGFIGSAVMVACAVGLYLAGDKPPSALLGVVAFVVFMLSMAQADVEGLRKR